MRKKDKISILERLRTGALNLGDLRPGRAYIITSTTHDPDLFECDGRIYNREECEALKDSIRKRNERLPEASRDVIFLEVRNYGTKPAE